MTFREGAEFFANMFDTDYNYAEQCLRDVSDFIVAAIECGESVFLPGCFTISLKKFDEIQRYDFKTGKVETIPVQYKLKVNWGKRLEAAARKDSALKRFAIRKTAAERKTGEEK